MSPFALFPLIATIIYLILLTTVANSGTIQKRHVLFILFLIPAIIWTVIDYLARSGYFPQYEQFFVRAVIVAFALMVVQFHLFIS